MAFPDNVEIKKISACANYQSYALSSDGCLWLWGYPLS